MIDLQPTKIHNPLLLPNINTQVLGQVYQYFEEIDSTQSFIKNLPSEKLADGMVVQAGFQTQGKGQMGSRWEAQPGENLTFSVYLDPEHWKMQSPWQLSMWVSTALCKTIQSFLPLAEVRVKWPNDILISNKKVAGILVENSFRGDHWQNSVIGIGWNIFQDTFHPDFLATSMKLEGCSLPEMSNYLKEFLQVWEILSPHQNQEKYLDLLWRKDQWQMIQRGAVQLGGCIRGVDENGKICMEWEDGKIQHYSLKELQFLR